MQFMQECAKQECNVQDNVMCVNVTHESDLETCSMWEDKSPCWGAGVPGLVDDANRRREEAGWCCPRT